MIGNWIVMTSGTTGGGNLSLDAVSGYPTIANQFANSVRFQYVLLNDADGKPVEAGIGYVTSGTTLVREVVIATYVSGTYSSYPSAASLTGTTRVIVTPLANGAGPVLTHIHSGASRYYFMQNYNHTGSDTKALTANVTLFIAGPVAVAGKISGMVCNITTAAGTGSNKLRMGIYSVGANGSPAGIIAETADGLPNSTGEKSLAFSSAISLPPAHYYLAVISDVGPTLRASAGGSTKGNLTSPLGSNGFSAQYGFGTDNNGGSTHSGWTTMPAYVGLSLTSMAADFSPIIGLVLA
jgi:hypothetical protein